LKKFVISFLFFPWLFQKYIFPWPFPDHIEFPDFFQFSLTCRNPVHYRQYVLLEWNAVYFSLLFHLRCGDHWPDWFKNRTNCVKFYDFRLHWLLLEVHRLSADNWYRPIISVYDRTIVTSQSLQYDLLNEDASWNKQSVIGRLFGADIRPADDTTVIIWFILCCFIVGKLVCQWLMVSTDSYWCAVSFESAIQSSMRMFLCIGCQYFPGFPSIVESSWKQGWSLKVLEFEFLGPWNSLNVLGKNQGELEKINEDMNQTTI